MRLPATPSLLLIALIAGCDGPPPFPTGQVTIDGQAVHLAALPVESAVPEDPQQAARWWQAWDARGSDPLRPWALARLDLLRPSPAAVQARQALTQLEPDPALTCLLDADLLVARWASGQRALALGQPGCAEDVPAGRAALAKLLVDVGLPRAAAEVDPGIAALAPPGPERDEDGELVGSVSRRTLFRRGPTLLLAAADASEPEVRAQAVDELRRITDAHVDRFALDERTRRWWEGSVDQDGSLSEALRDLADIDAGVPEDLAEARERASALGWLANRMGAEASGLPAARALHLRAWALDIAGAPHDEEVAAWEDLSAATERWPTLQVVAIQRLAHLATNHGELGRSSRLMQDATRLAELHRIDDVQARALQERWRLERRPALSETEVHELLEAHRERRPGLDGEHVMELQRTLATASAEAGWPALARATCTEALHLAARWDRACWATSCRALVVMDEEPATFLAGLSEAAHLSEQCNSPPTAASLLAEQAVRAWQLGDPETARAALDRAAALEPQLGAPYLLDLAGARLADPAAGPESLDAFDAVVGTLDSPAWNLDYEGALSQGYGHYIARRARVGAPGQELLGLVARREGVRWLGGRHAPLRPGGPDLLAVLGTWEGDVLLPTSWSEAPPLRPGPRPAGVLLDRAAMEGSSWITDELRPDATGSLALLGRWLAELGAGERTGPLMSLGTGPGAAAPLALMPVGDQPLGAQRPTGLWVPTDESGDRPPWERGTLLVGSGRIGAPGLPGVEELIEGAPPGWDWTEVHGVMEVAERSRAAGVLHLSAHGHTGPGGQAHLALGPTELDQLAAADLRTMDLQPGALVVLAACEAGGGSSGDLPMDLPMAAFQAGAGAVIFSRFPARSRPLHEALGQLYDQMPFACHELVERWHAIRLPFGVELLGVEVAVSTACLPR